MHCRMTILKLLLVQTITSIQDSTTIKHFIVPLNGSRYAKTKPNNIANTSTKNYYENSMQKEENNFEIDPRIVGGEKCPIEDYPWMVSIRTSRMTHYCGGALIAPRWVLSAAHCFEMNHKAPWNIRAVVGKSTLRRPSVQNIKVARVFIHKGYKNMKNDIALVALKRSVQLNLATIGFVKLPEKPLISDLSRICPSTSFMVAGWGSVKARPGRSASSSPELRCVQVPFITNEECESYISAGKDDTVICALYKPGGRDSCQGDSGGPLFCRGVQYGIVSFGFGCADARYPGVYTRVDRYLDFINDTLRDYVDFDSSSNLQINVYLLIILMLTVLCY